MSTPEVRTEQSFDTLLENHKMSDIVEISYAHSHFAQLLAPLLEKARGEGLNALEAEVRKFEDGHLVLIPDDNEGKEIPHQVRFCEGEPTNFSSPVAGVSEQELLGAIKLAYGANYLLVAVPSYDLVSTQTIGSGVSDRIFYQIYIQKRENPHQKKVLEPSPERTAADMVEKTKGQVSAQVPLAEGEEN